MTIFRHLLVLLLLVTSMPFSFLSSKEYNINTDPNPLMSKIRYQVGRTIIKSKEIPGLSEEELLSLKTGINILWEELFKEKSLLVEGTDQQVRPYFVALQATIEHVLSNTLMRHEWDTVPKSGIITELKGIIHTPMPATPLCTKGKISEELVDPSIAVDPARLQTVKVRTTTVRNYLHKGGKLFIVYPKEGINKRTEEQRKIYLDELSHYPKNLFDVPLDCENIPDELIGATYFFTDDTGETYVFSIKMTQAKDPKEKGKFGLWFGSIKDPAIQERVSSVLKFIEGSHSALPLGIQLPE